MNLDVVLRYATACAMGAEGFAPMAFLDDLPKPPVWTIGHGTTLVGGKPVHEGMTCTLEQADVWACSDLTASAKYVASHVKVATNDFELAALTSFCYNIGMGHFSTSSVLQALNRGQKTIAADRLLDYDEAGGKPVSGLETRRTRERSLFLTGTILLPPTHKPTPAATPVNPSDQSADALNAAELGSLNVSNPPESNT